MNKSTKYVTHFSGNKDQTAVRSWWPPMAAYESERSGEKYGRWNSFKEVWYGSRLKEIESGNAKLHTITEWRTKLRGLSGTKRVIKCNRERSAVFLKEICNDG